MYDRMNFSVHLLTAAKLLIAKRLKRALLVRTKHSMRISGVIPFIKLQNDT